MITTTRREVLNGGHIKGGIVAAHIAWVTDNHDAAAVAQFWKSLPVLTHEKLRGLILQTNWYDFADLIVVDRAIMSVFGSGTSGVLRELGGYSARKNVKTASAANVHTFLANGAKFHQTFMDFGAAEYVQTSATAGRMIHSNYTSFSPLYCESAIGYYRECVALHGVAGASVIESTCQCCGDDACTFVIRWR